MCRSIIYLCSASEKIFLQFQTYLNLNKNNTRTVEQSSKLELFSLEHFVQCLLIIYIFQQGKVLKWLESFLSNHSQQVIVNDLFYSPCEVIFGVLQGSVLGPTLFLLYINDITKGISSQMKLIADDCLMYRVIHYTADHHSLQQGLTKLSKWTDK